MSSFSASNSGAFTTNYTNDSTFYFIGQGTFEIWDRMRTGTGLGTFTTDWTVEGTGGSGQILSMVFAEGDYGNKTVTLILAAGGGTFQSGTGNTFQPPSVPCFAEGTKILTQHGYRKIELIGKNIMINEPTIFNCMYIMKKTEDNTLLEDLIITGGHSILVDELTHEEQHQQKLLRFDEKIDDKILLLASKSKKFNKIELKLICF